jgi:hypothetical protein
MGKVIMAIALLLTATACTSTTPYYGRGNSNIDYRGTSFSTVNSCTHNTALPCGFGG